MKIQEFLCKVFFHINNNFITLKNTEIGRYCHFAHHCEVKNSHIGDRSSIGRYTKIENSNIGKYCSISWNVTIGAPTHDIERITTNAFTYRKLFGLVTQDKNIQQKRTEIGNDVWIGCHAIIIAGVHIGNGAVIGAGAVVTKDVAPYTIVAGVPAKCIKYRFDDSIVKKIEQINWWDLDDDILKEHIDLFESKLNEQIIYQLLEIKEKSK